MRAVIATFGTDGDVFPFFGLGRELKARGHAVTMAASGAYQPLAHELGFEFHELVPQAESDQVFRNPDFWHPWKGGKLAAEWGIRLVPEQYRLLTVLAAGPDTVLVAGPAVLAARLVQERHGTPLASVILQPWVIPSAHLPPVFPGGLNLPRWAPRCLWRLYDSGLNAVGDLLIGRRLNALRREIGLPQLRRVFDWWFSPQLILALFPEWFGPPQRDWPAQVRLVSFPVFDGSTASLSQPIQDFLNAGEAPVAITLGTGIGHVAGLYREAVAACAQLGRRAIILTKYPEQVPQPLPAGMLSVGYAPFAELFPRCAAVIHHGGIGTMARALRAQTPQLVIPIAYDQLDNATRLARLGGGSFVPQRRATAQALAAALARVLKMRVSLPASEQDLAPADAFARAALLIERLGVGG